MFAKCDESGQNLCNNFSEVAYGHSDDPGLEIFKLTKQRKRSVLDKYLRKSGSLQICFVVNVNFWIFSHGENPRTNSNMRLKHAKRDK